MKVNIRVSYNTVYNNPLILEPGDEVILGEKEKLEKWSGWIFCDFNGNKGWVPEQIIKTEDNVNGIITESYSAKELEVSEGEILDQIKSLNGWVLLKNQRGETGWVPGENTEPL